MRHNNRADRKAPNTTELNQPEDDGQRLSYNTYQRGARGAAPPRLNHRNIAGAPLTKHDHKMKRSHASWLPPPRMTSYDCQRPGVETFRPNTGATLTFTSRSTTAVDTYDHHHLEPVPNLHRGGPTEPSVVRPPPRRPPRELAASNPRPRGAPLPAL
jgi:hypothetical protein